MFDLEARNNKIRENGKLTRQKRANQTCKTFKFKIDKSHLRKDQIEWLKMSMVEAKWIYNYMLANNGTDTDTKQKRGQQGLWVYGSTMLHFGIY